MIPMAVKMPITAKRARMARPVCPLDWIVEKFAKSLLHHPIFLFRLQRPNPKKYGVWDPVNDYNLTLFPLQSRLDSNTLTMGLPMPELTLTLCQSRLFSPVKDFEFGLRFELYSSEAVGCDSGK